MKTRPFARFVSAKNLARLASALLLQGSLVAQAQPSPDHSDPPNPPRHPRPPGERADNRFQPGPGMMLMDRVLDEDQRESMRSILAAQRETLRDIQDKIRSARKELLKASLAEKFDEDRVRSQALVVAKLEAELTVLRAKALSQVQPPLSGEQVARMLNPPLPRRPMDGEPRPNDRRDDRPPGPRDGDYPPRPPRPVGP